VVTATQVDTKIHSHEEICSIRYEQINMRLEKLERLVMRGMWGFMAGLATVILLLIQPLEITTKSITPPHYTQGVK
jgi:hypothetical protein